MKFALYGGLTDVLSQDLRFGESLGSIGVQDVLVGDLSGLLSDIFRNIVQNYVLLGANLALDWGLLWAILLGIGQILSWNWCMEQPWLLLLAQVQLAHVWVCLVSLVWLRTDQIVHLRLNIGVDWALIWLGSLRYSRLLLAGKTRTSLQYHLLLLRHLESLYGILLVKLDWFWDLKHDKTKNQNFSHSKSKI